MFEGAGKRNQHWLRQIAEKREAAIGAVFTTGYVAMLCGEDEDWLFDLAGDVFPEDRCLWVYGAGEDGVPAITRDGIECLRQITAARIAVSLHPPDAMRGRTLQSVWF